MKKVDRESDAPRPPGPHGRYPGPSGCCRRAPWSPNRKTSPSPRPRGAPKLQESSPGYPKKRYCKRILGIRHWPLPMDKRLLDILCCPVSKQPLRTLKPGELEMLNAGIEKGQVQNVAGEKLSQRVDEALVTTDGKVVYRVDDGIPVMLPEQGIGTVQFNEW